jgi:signal peptide peptidase SppA
MTEAAIIALLQPVPPSMAESAWRRSVRNEFRPNVKVDNQGIATIAITGALMRSPSLYELFTGNAEDTDHVREAVNAVAGDSNVRGIVLAIDSPGGMFNGGPELADAVRAARHQKPVVAHVSGMAASLAYMIASEAHQIVASPSASVGSIGAIAAHVDISGMLGQFGVKVEVFRSAGADLKAPGVYGTTLTEAQRETFQSTVDKVGSIFTGRVTQARPKARIAGLRGKMFLGDEAADLGLIDWAGDAALARALAITRKMP